MSHFGDLRRQILGEGPRHRPTLTAFDQHKNYINQYVNFYGSGGGGSKNPAPAAVRTDNDVIRDHHRFIRSGSDEDGTWEQRLAKRYYDKLFKEYCIADLSRYKDSKIGLRWRTEKEVMAGKGQFICGSKRCTEERGLCSYEVNFRYKEAGEPKQALVKLRVCPDCAYRLNYRKEGRFKKASRPRGRGGAAGGGQGEGTEEDAAAAEGEADAVAAPDEGGGTEGSRGDEDVWAGSKPKEEVVSQEEEFDEYLRGLFL